MDAHLHPSQSTKTNAPRGFLLNPTFPWSLAHSGQIPTLSCALLQGCAGKLPEHPERRLGATPRSSVPATRTPTPLGTPRTARRR